MGLFDRFFKSDEDTTPEPSISFGRYSDSYKTDDQYDAWDRSLELFDEGNFIDAYKAFLIYLRDEQQGNVQFEEIENGLSFEVYQGSKKIVGTVDKEKIRVKAKIAKAKDLKLAFMRQLMEFNYNLKYSRFALDNDNDITIVFDSYIIDGSPYKLYAAMKEVATHADKQDDLLLDEFKTLAAVESDHLESLPQTEKIVKYNFIQTEIAETIDSIRACKLDMQQYPGAKAYMLLNLIYKLDYLIRPEGYMMETLERAHRIYFSKNDKSIIQKNHDLEKEVTSLLERPKEHFFKEMYLVKSTFGITQPVNHDKLVSFINGELGNMDWYSDNQHEAIALAVPGYIAGHCLFNYALPKPDRELLHLYFRIVEDNYFKQLGFRSFWKDKETLDKKSIRKAITHVKTENGVQFPRFSPNMTLLRYDSLLAFSKSYFLMLYQLDLT